jgi:hypothetical protein
MTTGERFPILLGKSSCEINRKRPSIYTIASESSREFELIISEAVVREIANIFPEIAQQGYAITYRPSTSVLLIIPMPTAVM